MAHDTREDGNGFSSITAYVGNVHVKPISRLWNTYRLDRDYSNLNRESPRYKIKPQSVLKKDKKQERPFVLDYTKLSQMEYNIEEPAEEKIAKHAILEALF